MRYWEGKTVQLSNVALLSFSNILSLSRIGYYTRANVRFLCLGIGDLF